MAAGALLALVAARSLSGSGLPFLLLCGGLLRATLLLDAPDLSDDLRRYLFDARVAAAGVSPYAYPPSHPAVAAVDPELSRTLPHRDIRTVYPPLAQAAFLAGSVGGADGRPLRALFAAADLAVVPLLFALGGPGAGFGAALYAFHPLAVTESAGQGHLDSLGVALLLGAMVLLARNRRSSAGVVWALSVLTKYVSLAAAIPLMRRGGRRLAIPFLAVLFGLVLAAWWPGASPFGGLAEYATRWEFNSVLYPALEGLFEAGAVAERAKEWFLEGKAALGHPAWTERLFPFFYAGFFARSALAVALAIALLGIGRRVADTEAAVFASLGALLLASPTLQPWYLLWVLPFAARRREPAFLWLASAAPLSYALLYPTPGMSRPVVYSIEYIPFALLLAASLRRARRRVEATA